MKVKKAPTSFLIFTVVAVLLSQLPYYKVWLYGSPLPFDGFFGFLTWFTAQVNDIKLGQHPFSIRSDVLPGLVAPPYLNAGPLRLFLTALLPNDVATHALIQSVHISFSVLAVALLFYSLGIPWLYGLVGGLIFMQSGLHFALSQHVAAHESLLYFVLTLLFIRLFVVARASAYGKSYSFLWAALLALSISSLCWFFHEPVHLFLPIFLWTIGHLYIFSKELASSGKFASTVFMLICMAGAAGFSAFSTFLCALEMSYINKTQVAEFAGGLSYPAPLLLAGLLMPHVTAGLNIKSLDFTFGDANLYYFFAGTFTLFLNICALRNLWENGQKKLLTAFCAVAFCSLAFSLGADSKLHYIICLLFPPLGFFRHNYYGVKVLYLLLALGAAKGLQAIFETAKRNYLRLFLYAVLLQSIASTYLALYVKGHHPEFLASQFVNYFHFDWLWFIAANFVLLAILYAKNAYPTFRALSFYLVFALISNDLLWPAFNQHFFPQETSQTSYKDYSGALAAAKPYVDYLKTQRESGAGFSFRALRVFPHDVWLWANHLYPLGIGVLTTPDSQGSKDFEKAFKAHYANPASAAALAEEFGIDYFWIGSFQKDWQNKLASNPAFNPGVSKDWLGSIHSYSFQFTPLIKTDENGALLRWFLPSSIIQRQDGLFGTGWKISVPADQIRCGGHNRISLPFQWLSMFSLTAKNGSEVPFWRDSYGRIEVPCTDQLTHLELRYPTNSIKTLTMLGALTKIAIFLIAAFSLLVVLFKKSWVNP